MKKIIALVAACAPLLGGCFDPTADGRSSGSSSAAAAAASSTGSSGSSGTSGSGSTEQTSTGSSASTGSSGVVASNEGTCIANVLDGTPCPAGQTCNQAGTACVGDFAGPCASDADCPCGCSCAGAPTSSCTNCFSQITPVAFGCTQDSDCGPACLGFTCSGSGGTCGAAGLRVSTPSEAAICEASPCTDAGVACASLPCTPDGGECEAACGGEWTCAFGFDTVGPVLPGHCSEPEPGDGGAPASGTGFIGTFGGSEVFVDEVDGTWSGAGGGTGPDAYTQLFLPGPDAGTFIAAGLITGGSCSPEFQIVRPDFAVASAGTACPLSNFWYAPYVLTFGYAALDGDQLVIETLWAPVTADGGPPAGAVWYSDSLTRQ